VLSFSCCVLRLWREPAPWASARCVPWTLSAVSYQLFAAFLQLRGLPAHLQERLAARGGGAEGHRVPAPSRQLSLQMEMDCRTWGAGPAASDEAVRRPISSRPGCGLPEARGHRGAWIRRQTDGDLTDVRHRGVSGSRSRRSALAGDNMSGRYSTRGLTRPSSYKREEGSRTGRSMPLVKPVWVTVSASVDNSQLFERWSIAGTDVDHVAPGAPQRSL